MKKVVFGMLLISMTACHPFEIPDNGTGVTVNVSEKSMSDLNVPNGFTFTSTKSVNINIEALDNSGVALKNVSFSLFLKDKNETDSVFLMTAQTNTEGVFSAKINIQPTTESFIATTSYIGLPAYQSTAIDGSSNIKMIFGSENTKRDGLVNGISSGENNGSTDNNMGGPYSALSPDATVFTYLGNFNSSGVPKYLMSRGDVVQQNVLDLINSSLPESRPVPTYNPQYISNGTQTNIELKDSASVWITFVHEGAGYRNSVGYYSYPTNRPPQTKSEISKLNIIFPNVSFPGSGGDLKTGDKVFLGNFSAGTTVAWFLVPDGWVSQQAGVSDLYHPIHFSDSRLNTFTSQSYRSHTVLLNDPVHQLLLLGFEDLDRPSGDNDFNDAIFYASVNPFTAVNTTNLPAAQAAVNNDTDNDGVQNEVDVAPNDPTYAYHQFIPAINQYGSIAFEDAYPSRGDYDMNDLVVDYRFEQRTNSSNMVTQMEAKIVLRAMGASYRNGFGFELPVPASQVASVKGMTLKDNTVKLSSNGTESNQQNAVIMAFDNAFDLLRSPDNGFVNTEKGKQPVSTDTITLIIKFTTPVSPATLGTAPFNPFMFINRDRGREVHLAGMKPTSLANRALFGTAEDDSGNGKYYQTKNNLPWAILLPTTFAYPVEKSPINKAYLKFNEWAESKGTVYPDWYKLQPSYRNSDKIY